MKNLLLALMLMFCLALPIMAEESSEAWDNGVEHTQTIFTINGNAMFWIFILLWGMTSKKFESRVFPGADDEEHARQKNRDPEATLTDGDLQLLKNSKTRMVCKFTMIIVYAVLIFTVTNPGGLSLF